MSRESTPVPKLKLKDLPGNRWIRFRITQGIGIEEIESVWEQLPLA